MSTVLFVVCCGYLLPLLLLSLLLMFVSCYFVFLGGGTRVSEGTSDCRTKR